MKNIIKYIYLSIIILILIIIGIYSSLCIYDGMVSNAIISTAWENESEQAVLLIYRDENTGEKVVELTHKDKQIHLNIKHGVCEAYDKNTYEYMFLAYLDTFIPGKTILYDFEISDSYKNTFEIPNKIVFKRIKYNEK